jgi:phosphocarrier protein
MAEITLTIKNEVGLHARPASLFVKRANEYKSDIRVKFGEGNGNAKSILSMLTLGVNQGGIITISAVGEDADQAIAGLAELVESNFGEA